MNFYELLSYARRNTCSDIHLTVGTHTAVRRFGELELLEPIPDPQEVEDTILSILNEEQKARVGIKKTIKEYGIDEKDFLDRLDDMVEQAFDDQCTGANPRYPLMSEIKQMYLNAYYGKHFQEQDMPTEKDLPVEDTTDTIKAVYSKGRKA